MTPPPPPAAGDPGTATEQSSPVARSRIVRGLLLTLAIVSLGLAGLGLILPGLPCTEFVLLAAWAAAHSSPRFHAWLLRHRLFGPILRHWRDGRRVSRGAKWSASAAMLACSVLLIATVPHRWAVAAAVLCMAGVQIWLWRRPEPACA